MAFLRSVRVFRSVFKVLLEVSKDSHVISRLIADISLERVMITVLPYLTSFSLFFSLQIKTYLILTTRPSVGERTKLHLLSTISRSLRRH